MKRSPKLRPSFSIEQLEMIHKAVEEYITVLVKDGITKHQNDVLELIEVRNYLKSYIPDEVKLSREDIIRQFLEEREVLGIETISAKLDINKPTSTPKQSNLEQSVITRTDLTDVQKYQLLKLRDESELSDDEQVWMLNTGTLIMMRMASKGDKPIEPNDL